ncbi:MAG: methyltransferase domain-containing protein [Solirubrobacteraceae bacterium]
MAHERTIEPPSHSHGVAADQARVGRWGVSEELRSFVEEMPYERRSILAFVREVADSLPPGAVVVDIGAGDAPYRELFGHCKYLTVDWGESVHELASEVDLIAAADDLPFEDAFADAVLLTQVLEHVPDPAAVLGEVARALRPGGGAFLTVPFVWELHELPFDYWRFTPPSLERLLVGAGFVDVNIEARNDCFATVAQLMRNLRYAMGRAPDGRDAERDAAAGLLEQIADRVAALAPLDVNGILPLGWTARARRS